MMERKVVAARDLNDEQIQAWSDLQRSTPELDSPFFCPEFTQVVASVRDDVEVAVRKDGPRYVGFFPFQRRGTWAGQPAGGLFSEFHGMILQRGFDWPLAELLADCRLHCWSYHHVPLAQTAFAPYHTRVGDSPCIDLREGFDAYRQQKRLEKSSLFSQMRRKVRKLAQDVGPVQLELHSTEDADLDQLIRWKSAQHQRTGVRDVFRFSWVIQLLERMRDCQTGRFRGLMSVLRAGRRPVAVHLGCCSATVAHMWYPAYDIQLAKYSPGIAMFLELARQLAEFGIERIDFGPGPQRYKRSFQNSSIPVAMGTVDRWAVARWCRHSWSRAKRQISRSSWGTPARAAARMMFQRRQRMAIQAGEDNNGQ